MKGGEILHFRHFLISGFIACAAMFLPDSVLAEKPEVSGQENKASVHASESPKDNDTTVKATTPAKAEPIKALGKTVVQSELARKNNGQVKQHPSKIIPTTQKATKTLPTLPEQAKSKGQSTIKKAETAVKSAVREKVGAEKGNNGLDEKKPTKIPEKGNEKSAIKSALKDATKVKNKDQSTRLVHHMVSQGEHSQVAKLSKENSSQPLLPDSPKKGKVPTGRDEIPDFSQMMNPTKRTNSSGGPSHDRVIQGVNSVSMVDKWFEWNKFYEIRLVHTFLSRYALMNNQWVNAPPSPPPQKAPLLQTVNRS
jgi:hypothetical protein